MREELLREIMENLEKIEDAGHLEAIAAVVKEFVKLR